MTDMTETPDTNNESPVEKVRAAAKKIKKVKAEMKAKKEKNAVKAKKAKSEESGDARRINPDLKIKLLVDENPKREGSRSYKEFELYKDGMTVGELLKKGEKIDFRTSALRWDVAHEFIALK